YSILYRRYNPPPIIRTEKLSDTSEKIHHKKAVFVYSRFPYERKQEHYGREEQGGLERKKINKMSVILKFFITSHREI
ncbi:MAG: hypothetical protein KBS46_04595, partial [Clostridiales bacterium]|nr:hypothetical protein [Candidatus Apopatocola equi]